MDTMEEVLNGNNTALKIVMFRNGTSIIISRKDAEFIRDIIEKKKSKDLGKDSFVIVNKQDGGLSYLLNLKDIVHISCYQDR